VEKDKADKDRLLQREQMEGEPNLEPASTVGTALHHHLEHPVPSPLGRHLGAISGAGGDYAEV